MRLLPKDSVWPLFCLLSAWINTMFAICGPSTGRNCMQVNSNGIPHRTIMHKRQPKAEETVSGRQAVPPRPVEASGVRA